MFFSILVILGTPSLIISFVDFRQALSNTLHGETRQRQETCFLQNKETMQMQAIITVQRTILSRNVQDGKHFRGGEQELRKNAGAAE
jgi:hypothetical protein